MSKDNLDMFLDSNVSDFKMLPDLLDSLKREREKLRKQLFGLNVEGTAENEWNRVAVEARKTIKELEDINKQCSDVEEGAVSQQNGNEEQFTICDEVLLKLRDLDEVEKARKYLLWIKKTNHLSNEISSHLNKGNIGQSATLFSQLSNLSTSLSTSSCSQLKEFIMGVCEDQRILLKEALSNQYNEFLKIVSWPLTKDLSSKSLDAWKRKQPEFSQCFKHLVAIDRTQSTSLSDIPNIEDPLLLPIDLLINPLRKRFRYHFYGDRKTNARDKPEWYFTQVLQWISDCSNFLETNIQPHLSDTRCQNLDVKVEFTRGLVQELIRKIRHELNPSNHPTINDDYLFSHLMDELLSFDKELCNLHYYPSLYPKCIIVVQEESILCRWRNLEKQFAAEKLKAITESSTAWEPAYESLLRDEDDTRVPECAERFMQLIAGITERYRHIPVLYLRLQFLELQTDLLLEFSHDLSNAMRGNASLPLSNGFIAYLNASNYIQSILKQWGEEMFFLELHYYHKYINKGDNTAITNQLQLLRSVDPDFADLEGTAFEEVTEVFDTLCNDMIETLSSYCIEDIKRKSFAYKQERWHNLPVITDPNLFELSPSALGFLVHLQQLLHSLKSSIAPLIQDKLFDKLFFKLDEFLLSHIIYSNKFSRGGADQLHHDITQVIKPLVGDCIKDSYSSIAILKRTCDACHILKQPSSFIDLLDNLLQLAIGGDESAYQEVTSLLKEKDVLSLSLEETIKLTSLMIN